MKYRKLGNTGLDVSAVCLGCMTFGQPDQGYPAWTLSEEESRPILRRAIEAGINFFDTANVYSLGSSEEILGRALKEYANRDEVVIATKVWNAMRLAPNGRGLSRKAILTEVDNSLKRLGVDYIDLYQIHRLDHATPIEETLDALNDVVRAGKVLYLGACSMFAWEFSKALHLQIRNGWARFVSMQSHYNLINREEEREMLPLCADMGIGALPWSPLARGMLTREWDAASDRSSRDGFGKSLYVHQHGDREIVEAVATISRSRGISKAEVALAWLLKNPVVTAPIVGARTPLHIDDAVASLDVTLDAEELTLLENAYQPHPISQGPMRSN